MMFAERVVAAFVVGWVVAMAVVVSGVVGTDGAGELVTVVDSVVAAAPGVVFPAGEVVVSAGAGVDAVVVVMSAGAVLGVTVVVVVSAGAVLGVTVASATVERISAAEVVTSTCGAGDNFGSVCAVVGIPDVLLSTVVVEGREAVVAGVVPSTAVVVSGAGVVISSVTVDTSVGATVESIASVSSNVSLIQSTNLFHSESGSLSGWFHQAPLAG